MRLLDRVRHLLRALAHRRTADRDLDEELGDWATELTERHRRAGHSPSEARRLARLELGRVERLKDEVRSARLGARTRTVIRGAAREVRFARRSLGRTPGFTTAVVLTFALGIGANTAIFSVVRVMLLAPLPYRQSSQLVFIWSDMTAAGYPRAPLSGPELMDLRAAGTRFSGFGAIWANTTTLTGQGDPEQLRIGLVTTDFFRLLGVDAALGRTFTSDDDTASPSILLSWGLFQRRFGGDATLFGRPVIVNGQSATVVGVMPASFRLLMPTDASVPDGLEAWQPLRAPALAREPRGQLYLRVVGRMKPGVTLVEAQGEVAAIAASISRTFTEYGTAGRQFRVVGLQAEGVRLIRPALIAVFVGVTILLLIACANVAGLLGTRAASRGRETALRTSLGASPWHLARQSLAEGLVISVMGGAVGALVGWSGLKILLLWRPASLGRLGAASVDMRVLGFTAGVALVWGLVCSMAPLLEHLKTDASAALRHDGQRVTGDGRPRARTLLAVVQVALGAALLVAASLMTRTFEAVQHIDPGFAFDRAMTFRLAVPFARYRSPAAFVTFDRQLEGRLRALPGVTGAGAISHLPYDDLPNWGGPYLSQQGADASIAPDADYRSVTPGFFEETGVHLIEGRFFTDADDRSAAPSVIIDDLLAQRSWPSATAVGRQLWVDPGSNGVPTKSVTVVGVVRHLRVRSLVEDLTEQVYFPLAQALRDPMAWVVRTTGDPSALVTPIRAAVAGLDPQIPIYDVRPFSSYVKEASAGQRFTMSLVLCFAAVALMLAAVGVYGVMAYAVGRRRNEFGVRLALGARPGQLRAAVFREGGVILLAGLALGAVVAVPGAYLLRSQLFGVTPLDPVTYATAGALLGASLLGACWWPAQRATVANPLDLLREG